MQNTNVAGIQNGCIIWTCHLHTSDCTIRFVNNTYYHVVPVKKINVAAQKYNCHTAQDEFWEFFGNVLYVTPVAYSSAINDFEVFQNMMKTFSVLDKDNLRMSQYDTASDFMKKHFVLNADGTKMSMCNAHLIRHTSSKQQQIYYTRPVWLLAILKVLFPKIDIQKAGIPTNTPQWALNLYNTSKDRLRVKGRDRFAPYSSKKNMRSNDSTAVQL